MTRHPLARLGQSLKARLGPNPLHRLPILVALAFSVYSLALLAYSVHAWRVMKRDADTYLVADTTRRAATLGDLANVLLTKADAHAELPEVRAYLLNRDLGMSMQYGLGASLFAIEHAFGQHVANDAPGMTQRIIYLAEDGSVVADSRLGEPLPPNLPGAEGTPRILIDAQRGTLITAARVGHKGAHEGTIHTLGSTQVLYRNLMPEGAGANLERLFTLDGRELPGGGRPLSAALARNLLQAPAGQVVAVDALIDGLNSERELGDSLVVKTPVPGLPIYLLTLLPSERAYGHIAPFGMLVAAGLVPLLMLWGAFRLDRMRRSSEKLKADVLAADQRRQSAEQRNQELSAEIWRREMVEKALAESEERWELAVRGANDGIWDWNVLTGEVHFSDRWKSMLGYGTAEVHNTFPEWETRVHPEDLSRVMASLERHLRGETEFYQTEYRMRTKTGQYIWVLDRGQALFDAEGRAVRMAGSHTDITEQRAAEADVRERTEQLNAIFELSPDGFVSFNGAGLVSYVNPAFLAMTNLDPTRLKGTDQNGFSQLLASTCAPETRFRGIEAIRQLPLPAGRRELIEVLGGGKRVLEVGLRAGTGQQVSEILYFRDVTSETEVDHMKSEFLSTAAHELRTPMASIYGYAELLIAMEFSEAERKTFLGSIYQQAKLMASIINELLDLARIEARRGKDFKFERVDLAQLLSEALSGFHPPDGRPDPELRAPAQTEWVRADRKKLQQCINNVLSNAYKYSPNGGPVTVDLVPAPNEGDRPGSLEIGIRVQDRGIGMTPEQTARVCERFYRADTSGKIPGTGLGMSIVKEIMDLHGGRLTLESEPRQGTTVTLWLPAAPAEIEATAA